MMMTMVNRKLHHLLDGGQIVSVFMSRRDGESATIGGTGSWA